jgi:hypothetical protein
VTGWLWKMYECLSLLILGDGVGSRREFWVTGWLKGSALDKLDVSDWLQSRIVCGFLIRSDGWN